MDKQWSLLSRVGLAGAILLSAVPAFFSADQNVTAVTAFRTFLTTKKLDARWQDGDLRPIDSAELRTAYAGRQFYFTFRPAPVPPGAANADVIARYKTALQEYEKHSLRMTVGIDQASNVTPFQQAHDFNAGLMPVKNEADAKIAAAAILSLIGNDQVHPEAIAASEVTVTATNSGWTCKVKRVHGFDGTVDFDANGKCVSAKKVLNYVPPTPP
jgi:hypothetical protein